MTELEKAARQALSALKLIDDAMPFPVAKHAMSELRRALEQQPADEPVAWRYNGILHEFDPSDWAEGPITPLYTRPQEFVCSTGLCHYKPAAQIDTVTLTQTNVGIGERAMEAYEAAKQRGWSGVSDERLMKMPDEPVAWYRDEDGIRIYYESKCWDDAIPLYTRPQPAAQWVEVEKIKWEGDKLVAKLRELNGGQA